MPASQARFASSCRRAAAARGSRPTAASRGVRVEADGALRIAEVRAFPAGLGDVQPTALVDSGAAGLFVTLRVSRGGQPTDVLIRSVDGAWRELRAVPARQGWQLTGWAGTDRQWWTSFAGDAWFELGVGTGDEAWQPLARSRELAGRLHNLMADPDGGFWLATSTGLAHHVPTLWSTPRELASFTRPASTIFQARNGDLFIQHDNELLRRHEGPLAGVPPAARAGRRPGPDRRDGGDAGRADPARRPADPGDVLRSRARHVRAARPPARLVRRGPQPGPGRRRVGADDGNRGRSAAISNASTARTSRTSRPAPIAGGRCRRAP